MSVRQCDECADLFVEGYCIDNGWKYYCTEDCLKKNMSWDEFMELYDEGNGDSYWTEWWSIGIEDGDLEKIHKQVLTGKIENAMDVISWHDGDDQIIMCDYLESKGVKIT